MKKKIILTLMMLTFLSSCFNKKDDVEEKKEKEIVEVKEDKKSKKVEKKPEKKEEKKEIKEPTSDKYQNLYDGIVGKTFYLEGGSIINGLYFYKDGYFDGVTKSGNGGEVSISLYNGKFDIVEKISDTAYLMKLRRLDHELEEGLEKTVDLGRYDLAVRYSNFSPINVDDVSKSFILYLPAAKLSNFDEYSRMRINSNKSASDSINIFAIGSGEDESNTLFLELIEE